MNFNKVIRKKNKILLPLSWVYLLGVRIFNAIYNFGLKKSTSFPLPVICIGNLSVGGTGKTPMVEYLIALLHQHYKIATISRGYGRISKGTIIADATAKPEEIGDEPMQFHTKYPDILVAVGEQRVSVARALLKIHPETNIILLDDAFQHRAIQAGFNILLTEYENIFTEDYYLPGGQLRDLKSNYKKAHCIVVTKCPENLSSAAAHKIIKNIRPITNQTVFFTTLVYGMPYHIFSLEKADLSKAATILLVAGIANPALLLRKLRNYKASVQPYIFDDHHNYTVAEIMNITARLNSITEEPSIILTTEKDAVKLRKFRDILLHKKVYALPVAHLFLFEEQEKFNTLIQEFIQTYGFRKN